MSSSKIEPSARASHAASVSDMDEEELEDNELDELEDELDDKDE
jgi:hypothetical protein